MRRQRRSTLARQDRPHGSREQPRIWWAAAVSGCNVTTMLAEPTFRICHNLLSPWGQLRRTDDFNVAVAKVADSGVCTESLMPPCYEAGSPCSLKVRRTDDALRYCDFLRGSVVAFPAFLNSAGRDGLAADCQHSHVLPNRPGTSTRRMLRPNF